MITVEEYVEKVNGFIELWREEMISDIELVESVHRLEAEVMIIQGDDKVGFYSTVPFSQIQPRPSQTPQ